MRVVDEYGREEPAPDADELGTLVDFLEFHRATLEWKCAGLDEAGLRAALAPSAMTLGGMLNHLALVEDNWFSRYLLGAERHRTWDGVDWAKDRDFEWRTAATMSADALRARWHEAVERSRAHLAAAVRRGGLDQPAERAWPDGLVPSLRWILVHMVEEYARHNGHADLIRESIDGSVGE